jgi:NADH dehydrogenase FAD-containing subunit
MSSTVVVIGGGYGGAAVARGLDAEANIVLIDPRDAFMNSAGSLRGVTQPDWAARMFFPYKDFIKQGTLVRDHAVSVDPKGVTVSSGQRIDADYIVLATGSSYAYPAKPRSHSTEDSIEDLRRTHEQLVDAERVLILGAGPVGLELAGEIKEVWPDRSVTIIDPAGQLLAGFQPEVRESLERQLAELNVEVRLGTTLSSPPATECGQNKTFTVTTTAGDEITADIWFRAHGVVTNSDYLTDGLLTPLTPAKQVPVTETLNVQGHEHVYAIGDLTDVAEAKMAGYAMQHAEVVRQNISAQLKGESPTATYQPLPFPMILLPLGPRGGVGQLPSAEGPSVAPTETVSQFKGADLFTGMLSQQFSPS